ncbi:MAG: RusA family crossover junction endodeoxyribonuclease [Nitrospirales bacterium]
MRPIRIPTLPKLSQSKGKGSLVLLPSHRRKARASDSRSDWSNLGGDLLSTNALFVVLPLPPSINHQYATVNGRRVLSSTGRQYKIAVGKHLSAVLRQSPLRGDFLEQLETHSLSLSLRFFFKSTLRRDLDGGLKIAQDAICQAIGLNDNRITAIHLLKDLDADRPRMECTLAIQQPLPKTTTSSRRFSVVPKTRRHTPSRTSQA